MLNKNALTYTLCALTTLSVAYFAVVVRQSAGLDADLPLAALAVYINVWFCRNARAQSLAR